ncbi:unnamed protein product [Blepharisma stoltei]|uniref:TmcB/TmcC TPR repeats domain-containing protein n=1 Tax=Blepharisma stoltei TaxID=1481888 RepID=A0AAU9JCH6_9CILI|nr:unnamed protein product [Blepharisma stoltei]
MIDFEAEIGEASSLNKKNYGRKEEKPILNAIFEFFSILYYQKSYLGLTLPQQKVKIAIEVSLWCLQMTSLLWIPNLQIEDWKENMIMWRIIGYLKIDNTCSALGIADTCLYILMACVFAVFFGMFALVLVLYYSISLPAIIFSVFKRLICIWLNILYIPSLELFTIFLKYNFSQQKNVLEYEENDNSANFKISSPIQALSFIAIIVNFLIFFLYSMLSGEIRHCTAKSIVKAKAHSKIEIHAAIFTFAFPILYSIFADNYIIHLQILALISSAFLLAETITFLPYFSEYCSILVIIRFFTVTLMSFLFIFGYCVDNSLFITLFAIILFPISIVFIIIYALKLQRKLSKNIPDNISGIKSQYNLEKSLRYALCSGNVENKNEIIRIFENFFMSKSLDRDKLQVIWVTNYCLFTLKNEALAKIKLSKIKYTSGWNLEEKYQEYLCNKIIMESDSNESVSYENYYHKIHQIKQQDRKLCINLSVFWEEVTCKKPSFSKLIKSLNSINDGITFLNTEYKQLTTKYDNSRDALGLYFLYMRNILHDYDNSDKLNYKLRFFDRIFSSITNEAQNLSCFNSNNGILLISNEEKNFGEILFASSRAAEIFKLSTHGIVGNNINHFIPEPYNQKTVDTMSEMVHFSSITEIYFNDGCFFITPRNFLLECIGKASITSINNVIATILVFRLNKSTHQVALISEDGEIYSYTEDFPSLIGHDNLVGANIKSLFPDLEEINFQPLVPYNLSGFKNEMILVMCYTEFYNIKIPYVLLINDPDEILKWKDEKWRQQDNLQEENFVRPTPLSFHMFRSSPSEENSLLMSKEMLDPKSDCLSNPDETTKLASNHAKGKNDDEKSQTESSSLSVFLHMMKISSRAIDALHIVFVILIVVVLATNLAVLFYAFNGIGIVRDISLPKTIGDIGKAFQQLGVLSRLLYMLNGLEGIDSVLQLCFNRFQENVVALDNLYINAASNLTDWKSCSGTSIFTEKNINLWKIDDGMYTVKTTLMDTIGQFVQSGYEFITKYNNGGNFYKETAFFAINGYGESFKYCYDSLCDVISCKKSAISDFRTEIYILLVLGIIVLSIGIVIMVPFCNSAIKTENILWNNIRKYATKNYLELKQSCILRLNSVHNQHETVIFNGNRSKNLLSFRSYWKYIWRVTLFLIATSIFCIINITYFYQKCADYLYYRPEVTKQLITSQVLFTNFNIWITEAAMQTPGFSLADMLPLGSPFSNAILNLDEIIAQIKSSQLTFRKSKHSEILPRSLKKQFFEKDSCEIKEHNFGVFSGGEISIFDGLLVSRLQGDAVDVWLALMVSLQELDTDYNELIEKYNQYSQSVIDDQMSVIIGVLAIFIVISIVMYFGVYLIFFRNEKKYLQKINSMLQIMPEKVINIRDI